jgi:putative salt-induced outer membrane protein YdiY
VIFSVYALTRLRRSFVWLLFLLVAAPSRSVLGQPPPPAPAPPPPLLEGSAQFTFLDTRGNAPAQSLGGGGDLVWRPDPWTYNAKVLFAQTESDDELKARSLASLVRASRALDPRLSLYGQYDFLRDIFAGIEQRHVLEGGVSYLAVDTAPHRLRVDAGVGYLAEQHPADRFDSATLTLTAAYRLAISETSEFKLEPRLLLPIPETGAWKYTQDASLAVALNSILSLKVAHTLRYSAEPAAGFDTTDTIMAISLVARVVRPR